MADEAVELRSLVSECESILIAAGTARTKGDVFVHEDALAIAADDYAADVEVVGYVVIPRAQVPKAAVVAVAGQDAFYDSTNETFTNVEGANRKCGHVEEAAAVSAATMLIYYDGYGS